MKLLSLLGQDKKYLGMIIRQTKEYFMIDQDQYTRNIFGRFEKSFKHQLKQ